MYPGTGGYSGASIADSGAVTFTANGYKPSATKVTMLMMCKQPYGKDVQNMFDTTITDPNASGGGGSCSIAAKTQVADATYSSDKTITAKDDLFNGINDSCKLSECTL
jgi:hypothetical protein